MMAYVVLTLVVLLALLYPIRKRPIDFDEKGEAIRVYHDEVKHIEQQFDKGLIDEAAKAQLLDELDKKSATAMLAIDQKTYAYRSAFVPAVLIVLGLAVGGMVYAKFYRDQGIDQWHAQGQATQDKIIAGLFNPGSARDFVAQQPQAQAQTHCFLMQHEMLANYADNADALANVAQCHSALGFADLANGAIERALRQTPDHAGANYAKAELEMLRQSRLSPQTESRLSAIYHKQPQQIDIGYLLLVNSYAKGAYDEVIDYAKRLRAHAGGNQALIQAVSNFEAEAQVQAAETVIPGKQIENTTAAPIPVHSAPQSENPKQETAAPASFSASIIIAPELQAGLSEPKTLFVIVKTPEGGLLSAGKYQFSDFNKPLEVTLTDDQVGIMQFQPMAGHEKIQVVARISQTGNTTAQAGDLTSAPILIDLPQSNQTTLTIDQTVQ